MYKLASLSLILLAIGSGNTVLAQNKIDQIINPQEVEKVENVLAGDAMRGRASFTPDIERAADYIEEQFKAAGLQTWNGSGSYRQPFAMVQATAKSIHAQLDGVDIPENRVLLASSQASLSVNEQSGYEKVFVKDRNELGEVMMRYASHPEKNALILVDTGFAKFADRIRQFISTQFKSPYSVIIVFSSSDPAKYSIQAEQEVKESKLANVVGILPGKSKKNEYVIFSGHYDHLGVGSPDNKGDSIFNGANDDASGTTAVIMLARYFGKLRNNERTLVFAAFTAEEIGEFGSQYFATQWDPAAVKAMFNIEMIGTESKWGTNSAYITGYERTDMGKILEKNLTGTGFSFHPDPYPDQQLFYRSDNASLAKKGVPAHTISTSKMDSEKFYHTQGDEVSTLDMKNMARIIQSVALSSRTIISGADTPSRVDTSKIR